MAVKSNFASGDVLTASDVNTYLTNGGLVYINETAVGSGVTTFDVIGFSSTYDNYRIVWSNITCSVSNDLTIQLGNSGSFSNTGYYRINPYVTSGAVFTAGFSANGANFFASSSPSTSAKHAGFLEVQQPYLAQYTLLSGPIYQQRTDLIGIGVFGSHQVATSYDRMRFTTSTGTITGGKAILYGYRQA